MRGSSTQVATNIRIDNDRYRNQGDGPQILEQQEERNSNLDKENMTQEDMNFANNEYIGIPITEQKEEMNIVCNVGTQMDYH